MEFRLISSLARKVDNSVHEAVSKALDSITYEVVKKVRELTGKEVSVLEATRSVNSISNKIELPNNVNTNIVAMVINTKSGFMQKVMNQAVKDIMSSTFNVK